MSELMPWEKIEEQYKGNMSEETGRGAIPSRIAFGAIYVKEKQKLTDEETVEEISENVYLQYFLGLSEYEERALFNPSMMVHFRRRFTVEFIGEVNEYICRKMEK